MLTITEVMDMLREQEIEAGHLRRGETSIILTLTGDEDREFKVLIQRPGQPDEQVQMDEGELLDWWMHFQG